MRRNTDGSAAPGPPSPALGRRCPDRVGPLRAELGAVRALEPEGRAGEADRRELEPEAHALERDSLFRGVSGRRNLPLDPAVPEAPGPEDPGDPVEELHGLPP